MAVVLNDIHSRLNATTVDRVVRPRDVDEVRAAITQAKVENRTISVSGGRHAMGGQQFGAGTLHLDMTGMTRVLGFDRDRGHIQLEAGADWPTIIAATHAVQDDGVRWGIRQKQTGADMLTLGGTIAANAHGRGLLMGPIVDDIEEVTLVTADGEVMRCSREENQELFSLVVGGYGLFGIVVAATLRLSPRLKVQRIVNVIDLDDAMNAVYRRVAEGCLYGDFQYAIEPSDDGFLKRGVMACYKPADEAAPLSDDAGDLPREAWLSLLALAHSDKTRAFAEYARHYIGTHGRVYWSDTMQLGMYIPSYSEFLLSAGVRPAGGPDESLMIGEHYVQPEKLMDFMEMARRQLREHGVENIYGTIRSIRGDTTTFLPWAEQDRACVIFNLRTVHTPEGVARTHQAFRGLTDAALDLGGGFYLTYHRAATQKQVERAYPRFEQFLEMKKKYDPHERFQSEWYRHYRELWRERAAGVAQ